MTFPHPKVERFSSKWGLLAASLGCAIGVGNIWRFPRIVAENGGGAFLIPWFLFLFLWSIPLMIAEYSIGRRTREGVIGSFARFGATNRAWMGGFVALVATAVLFYYSVIAGWCFYYFVSTLGGGLSAMAHGGATDFFMAFTGSSAEYLYMAIPLLICGTIVYVGGIRGIEKMNSFMVPALFVLLIFAAIVACRLPGAIEGVKYLFVPKWEYLWNYKTWVAALAQSAWSTGAGFGLYLTYAVYISDDEDIVTNTVLTGVGNNIASIIAALAIIPTVFAVLPIAEATEALTKSSVGLTFLTLPELFLKMPLGSLFAPIFFLTLIFAALSSLISLIELPVRVIMDFGATRQRAVVIVVVSALLFGSASAMSLDFLDNQDFVWGQGLIISGIFLAVLIISYGTTKFREEVVHQEEEIHAGTRAHMRVGRWFDTVVTYVIPAEFTALMLWWAFEAIGSEPSWWNPFAIKSLGTCLFQWGIAMGVLYMMNDFLKNRARTHEENGLSL